MNQAASFLPKFFVICSVILIITGVMQVFFRPRQPKETAAQRLINRATITAAVTVTFGVLGLLVGLGIVPMVRFQLG